MSSDEEKVKKLLRLANDPGASDNERTVALKKVKEIRERISREAIGAPAKRTRPSSLSPDWASLGGDMDRYRRRMEEGKDGKRIVRDYTEGDFEPDREADMVDAFDFATSRFRRRVNERGNVHFGPRRKR